MAMSVGFLAAIYVSAVIVVTGEWLVVALFRRFPGSDAPAVWNWVRFVILFLMMLSVIYALYVVSTPGRARVGGCMPGAALASGALVGVGMLFSRLISESARYAIAYGYFASFALMLVWLYACGIILITGGIFNAARSGKLSTSARPYNADNEA
jgi:membrane protein